MIVVVGGIKGGSGKTTVATNLAVLRAEEGYKVLLVDADEQRSTSDWAEHRLALGIPTEFTIITLFGKEMIRAQLDKLKNQYDSIFIDVSGHDTTSQRAAILKADMMIIPFKPRIFDVWTLPLIKDLLEDAFSINETLKVIAFINQADSKGSDNNDARNILKDCPRLKILEKTLGNRKAFSNAASEGLAVTELQKQDGKATQEMYELYHQIFDDDI